MNDLEQHLRYLQQIIADALPAGYGVEQCDQNTGASENYWRRIACGREKETVEFPDEWVEDRDDAKIRHCIKEALDRLRRRCAKPLG
jgi:hypothetical protein